MNSHRFVQGDEPVKVYGLDGKEIDMKKASKDLLKRASSLPVGSSERRDILASLRAASFKAGDHVICTKTHDKANGEYDIEEGDEFIVHISHGNRLYLNPTGTTVRRYAEDEIPVGNSKYFRLWGIQDKRASSPAQINQAIYDAVIGKVKADPDTISDMKMLAKETDTFWVDALDEVESYLRGFERQQEPIERSAAYDDLLSSLSDALDSVGEKIGEWYQNPMNFPPGHKLPKNLKVPDAQNDFKDADLADIVKKLAPSAYKTWESYEKAEQDARRKMKSEPAKRRTVFVMDILENIQPSATFAVVEERVLSIPPARLKILDRHMKEWNDFRDTANEKSDKGEKFDWTAHSNELDAHAKMIVAEFPELLGKSKMGADEGLT